MGGPTLNIFSLLISALGTCYRATYEKKLGPDTPTYEFTILTLVNQPQILTPLSLITRVQGELQRAIAENT